MASDNPTCSHVNAFQYAPFFNGLCRVMGAGWLEATVFSQQWREISLIESYGKYENPLQGFLIFTKVTQSSRQLRQMGHFSMARNKASSKDAALNAFPIFSRAAGIMNVINATHDKIAATIKS